MRILGPGAVVARRRLRGLPAPGGLEDTSRPEGVLPPLTGEQLADSRVVPLGLRYPPPSARDLERAQVLLCRAAALAAFDPACLRLRGQGRACIWGITGFTVPTQQAGFSCACLEASTTASSSSALTGWLRARAGCRPGGPPRRAAASSGAARRGGLRCGPTSGWQVEVRTAGPGASRAPVVSPALATSSCVQRLHFRQPRAGRRGHVQRLHMASPAGAGAWSLLAPLARSRGAGDQAWRDLPGNREWAVQDSNLRPPACKAGALAS